jgi:hypothetical protein
MQEFGLATDLSVPWSMQVSAVSAIEPVRLVESLVKAILGCGGWVLSHGANEAGDINMLFQFERHVCIDIYGALVSAGLDLSDSSHVGFTELCQCTRNHLLECGSDLASVELEVRSCPVELKAIAPVPSISQT